MGLFGSLVFSALCLLHIAASADLTTGVPDCSGLGKDALKKEEREIVAQRFSKAMKNLQAAEYYCALEKMAKFSVFIPGYNDQNRYDTVEFRHEEPTSTGFERLVRKSIHSWSKDFKKINGSRKIGCNYDTVNGNEALVCLVGQ